MTGQELRDRLASVREYTVIVDGKPALDTAVDIVKKQVYILTTPAQGKKEEVKK